MMSVGRVMDAEPSTLAGFDLVIDARSPGEYALDHIPGSVNLPVLSDAERAEVGTIYVQRSRFEARRIGGAYVAKNVAHHLETVGKGWPASARILVYCWRGGMRSGAMATILSQVGWRTATLEGGYRTYRRRVSERLYGAEVLSHAVVIDGGTGCGKTEILHRLAARGVQVLDLEGLAVHRGSLFGHHRDRPQPSQRLFESRLLAAVEALDPALPVVMEAESSKVGALMTPPRVWGALTTAPRIEIEAPVEARARYLARAYSDIAADVDAVVATIERLPDRVGTLRRRAMAALAVAGDHETLARELIEAHYDPAYRRVSKRSGGPRVARISLADLSPADLERATSAVIEALGVAAEPSPSHFPAALADDHDRPT